MLDRCDKALARSGALNLYGYGLIAIKGSDITPRWDSQGNEVRGFRKGYCDDPEKFFQVEAQLPPQEKEELVEFLRRNIDIFVWNTYEALGVDPSFICHHLNVNPSIIPKKQLLRHSPKDHSNAVRDEVTKLKQARAIKEVFYPEWLANTVVVKKKSEKW